MIRSSSRQNFLSIDTAVAVALMLCALLPRGAWATPPANDAIPFFLCSTNIKDITLTKVPGSDTNWEFVIILNGTGTEQFRALEEAIPGRLVDIVWAGISFGKRRLDLPVQSNAKQLVLGSKWFSVGAAQATFDRLKKNLLQKRNLSSPCGVG